MTPTLGDRVGGGRGGTTRAGADRAPRLGASRAHLLWPQGDAPITIDALVAVHDGADAWHEYFRRREVVVVTLTVTEAGYGRGSCSRLDCHA